MDAYLTSLIAELTYYEKAVGFDKLQTVYIGGGTPTVLATKQLDRLFSYLHSFIDFNKLTEVSVEANPESLNDACKVSCLKQNGVTRISLGVQSFNADHLKMLQRSHTEKDICKVIAMLNKENFEINVDMIYGIPSQSLKDWEQDLERLLRLPVTHISAYSLILEEHTKFHNEYAKDNLKLVDNEVEAQMFKLVIDKLVSAGFEHYEVSNFTKNKRSFHNMMYWKNEHYIGVGLGAHGHINGSRYENTRGMPSYKKALELGELPITNSHALTDKEQIEESMFLGLRLMEGIDFDVLQAKYRVNIYELYQPKIDKLCNLGYVSLKSGVLRLTKKGLMMANDVFEEFLL